MKTDWDLIREMMSAAIDTCERIDACGYSEMIETRAPSWLGEM